MGLDLYGDGLTYTGVLDRRVPSHKGNPVNEDQRAALRLMTIRFYDMAYKHYNLPKTFPATADEIVLLRDVLRERGEPFLPPIHFMGLEVVEMNEDLVEKIAKFVERQKDCDPRWLAAQIRMRKFEEVAPSKEVADERAKAQEDFERRHL